jgi:hypothetical protein
VWGKQTIEQLANAKRVSVPVLRSKLDQYQIPLSQPCQQLVPGSIVLVIDAYFRKRGDGTIVFRAPGLGKNLLWYDIQYETVATYLYGVKLLQDAGWKILGFTVDGRRGVVSALETIAPVQHCQFHQKATIRRYLTNRPKLLAAQELKAIAAQLTVTDQDSFTAQLEIWHRAWDKLLKERTQHPSGGWSYTHRHLRAAYRSLNTNSPWLFTCHQYPDIPNTTNSLDGSISHLRTMHRVHRGIQLHRRLKLTDELLRGRYPK